MICPDQGTSQFGGIAGVQPPRLRTARELEAEWLAEHWALVGAFQKVRRREPLCWADRFHVWKERDREQLANNAVRAEQWATKLKVIGKFLPMSFPIPAGIKI